MIGIFGLIGTVGAVFITLAYNALRDIRKTTNEIRKTVQGILVHLAKINGSIAEAKNDLVAHIKDNEKTEARITEELRENRQSVQNICTKANA